MSSAEQQSKPTYEFAGWIPTVAGRLSFRHIGEGRFPELSSYANVTTASDRKILAIQRRPLSDALFPSLTGFFTRHSGEFWFTLTALNSGGACAGDVVEGRISIFRDAAEWRQINSRIRRAISRLNFLGHDCPSKHYPEIDQIHSKFESELEAKSDISVQFKLLRTGEVYFAKPTFKDTTVLQASVDYAEEQGQDILRWVADQAYFFLRDVIHQHQHHDKSEDTILVLQPLDPQDLEWRKKIIYSLYFRIVRARRGDHYPHAARAAGILAYCQSFKEISGEVFAKAKEAVPAYNDSALEASLRAKLQEETSTYQKNAADALDRATRSTNRRMIALTLVLIVLGVFAVFADAVSTYPPNEEFGRRLVPLLIPILKSMAAIMVLVWVASSEIVFKFQSVLELSNVRRRGAMILYFIIACLLLGSLIYGLSPQLGNILRSITTPLTVRLDEQANQGAAIGLQARPTRNGTGASVTTPSRALPGTQIVPGPITHPQPRPANND